MTRHFTDIEITARNSYVGKVISILRILERGGSKIFSTCFSRERIAQPPQARSWKTIRCFDSVYEESWRRAAAKNNLSEHRTILCSFLIAFTVVHVPVVAM